MAGFLQQPLSPQRLSLAPQPIAPDEPCAEFQSVAGPVFVNSLAVCSPESSHLDNVPGSNPDGEAREQLQQQQSPQHLSLAPQPTADDEHVGNSLAACSLVTPQPELNHLDYVPDSNPDSGVSEQFPITSTWTKENYLRDDMTDSDDSLYDPDYIPEPSDESQLSDVDDMTVEIQTKKQPEPHSSKLASVSSLDCEDLDLQQLPIAHEHDKDRGLSLFKKQSITSGCKQVYDKVHFCTYCGMSITSKMARHLVTVHVGEDEVKAIRLLPKRSKERRMLLQQLTNEGDFKHNIAVMQAGEGGVVVGRRSYMKTKQPSDYTACEFCKKWLSKQNLWRHSKTCLARAAFYEKHTDYLDRNSEGSEKKRIQAVKRGKGLVANAIFTAKNGKLTELANRMRDDKIKDIVLSDELICREAELRMDALGMKADQKQDDIYRVSQAGRTLGRLLLHAKETTPDVRLYDLLVPEKFDQVVEIAKKMSTDKESPALNVGRSVGLLLTKVCDSKYCLALRKSDRLGERDAKSFKKMIEREWNSRVSRAATRRINSEKRSKVPLIPVTEDLQLFRKYVMANMRELTDKLMKRPRPQDWLSLAKFTMSRLILFNKRRRGEVRELKVDEYLARPKWSDDNSGEMALALSPVDRLMAQR